MYSGRISRLAERVALEKAAEKAVARLGLRRAGVTAQDALQEALERAAGGLDSLDPMSIEAGDDLAALERLYAEYVDRLAKIAKMMADAGIDQKRLELDQKTVLVFASAIQQILQGLPLTRSSRPEPHRWLSM